MSIANFPKGSKVEVVSEDAVVQVGSKGVVCGYDYEYGFEWCAIDFGEQDIQFARGTRKSNCDGKIESGNGAYVIVQHLKLVEE